MSHRRVLSRHLGQCEKPEAQVGAGLSTAPVFHRSWEYCLLGTEGVSGGDRCSPKNNSDSVVRREQLSAASVSSTAGSSEPTPPHAHSGAGAKAGAGWGLNQAFPRTPRRPPSRLQSSCLPFSFSSLPHSALFFLSLNSTPGGRSQEESGLSSPSPVPAPRLLPSQTAASTEAGPAKDRDGQGAPLRLSPAGAELSLDGRSTGRTRDQPPTHLQASANAKGMVLSSRNYGGSSPLVSSPDRASD